MVPNYFYFLLFNTSNIQTPFSFSYIMLYLQWCNFLFFFFLFGLVNTLLPTLKFIWKLVFQKYCHRSLPWLQFFVFFRPPYEPCQEQPTCSQFHSSACPTLAFSLKFVPLLYTNTPLSKCKEENMSVCLALEAGNKLSVKILRATRLPSFKYILQVWCLWIIHWCWDSQGTWTPARSCAPSILTAPMCFPNTFLTFIRCLIFTFQLRNCLHRSKLCLCICSVCSIMVPWPLGTITI